MTQYNLFDRIGLYLSLLVGALIVFVGGVQTGMWWQRTHFAQVVFHPTILHAKCPPPPPCLPFKYINSSGRITHQKPGTYKCEPQPPCYFADDHGREMIVKQRGQYIYPSYPEPSPQAKTQWEIAP